MKTFTEDVIVKDYGKQGLAVFVPTDPATLGNICGFMTIISYDGEPRGFRPDCLNVPYNYSEASMGYFLAGRKPKADDPRVAPFLEHYRKFSEDAYNWGEGEQCKLTLRRVFKDQQRYRAERWKS